MSTKFEKGQSGNPGGRPKGVPNKSTIAVKTALSEAFEGMGGVERLRQWAEENPALFYPLWVKMLPMDVKADVAGKLQIEWQKSE